MIHYRLPPPPERIPPPPLLILPVFILVLGAGVYDRFGAVCCVRILVFLLVLRVLIWLFLFVLELSTGVARRVCTLRFAALILFAFELALENVRSVVRVFLPGF